jgi:glutamine amidotransferase
VIALIDYRAGNLTSVRKAFAAIGAEVFTPGSPADLARASGVVVPGVGHFTATRALEGDWTTAVLERLGEGRPIFGICLGMQWLFEGSEEAPDCRGLGVLRGRCVRLNAGKSDDGAVRVPPAARIKIPHVGWNSLDLRFDAPIAAGVAPNAQVYFTHSYAAPVTGDTAAVTEHGQPFAAIVQRGPVAGVQFHPELSGDAGLQILRNFMELAH